MPSGFRDLIQPPVFSLGAPNTCRSGLEMTVIHRVISGGDTLWLDAKLDEILSLRRSARKPCSRQADKPAFGKLAQRPSPGVAKCALAHDHRALSILNAPFHRENRAPARPARQENHVGLKASERLPQPLAKQRTPKRTALSKRVDSNSPKALLLISGPAIFAARLPQLDRQQIAGAGGRLEPSAVIRPNVIKNDRSAALFNGGVTRGSEDLAIFISPRTPIGRTLEVLSSMGLV